MKYKITFLITLSLLFIINTSKAQSPYYDALSLRKLITTKGKNPHFVSTSKDTLSLITTILKNYFPMEDSVTWAMARNKTKGNVFIHKYFPEMTSMDAQRKSAPGNIISNVISEAGGLNVTNFADGAAQFIVERLKQELSETFFEKFKRDLNDPKLHNLQVLFPQTCKTLNTIDNGIYQYSAYLNTLRQSFLNDLTNAYTNLGIFIDQPEFKPYFDKNPDVYTIIKNSLYLINCYANGMHPGQVIAGLDTSSMRFSDSTLMENTRNSIALLQLFSNSLKSKSAGRYWVQADSIEALLRDKISRDIYLGLLFEKSKGIHFIADKKTFTFQFLLSKADTLEDSLVKYHHFIETFIAQAQEIEEYTAALKSKPKQDIDYNDYYKLYNASLDLLQDAFSFTGLPYVNKYLPGKTINDINRQGSKWIYVARSTGELYIDVRTKNYTSAILNMGSIIDTVLAFKNDPYTAYLNRNIDKISALLKTKKHFILKTAKNYAEKPTLDKGSFNTELSGKGITDQAIVNNCDSLLIYTKLLNTTKNNSAFMSALVKYGTFMATVASAKNSADVKAAIEAAALPAGSSSIKQHSYTSVMVDSYVGALFAKATTPDKQGHLILSAGPTAPIGISFNYGFNCRSIGCASLFLSVIDIGAFAAFRLNDSTTQALPKTTLSNILAPGAHLIIGRLLNTPLSINIGYQMAPQLRSISTTNTDVTSSNQWQWQVAITWNIPFFNLYSQSRQ